MSSTTAGSTAAAPGLKRALGLWDLVFYGIIVIQPTAPMPGYGVFANASQGQVVTCILIGMVAMVFTAISYGRMARVYPSAGSAYTYVGREIHPALGFVTGWSMTMDYMINPLICTIWCGKAMLDFFPGVSPRWWFIAFALVFTCSTCAASRPRRASTRCCSPPWESSSSPSSASPSATCIPPARIPRRSSCSRSTTRTPSPRACCCTGPRWRCSPTSASTASPRSPKKSTIPSATSCSRRCWCASSPASWRRPRCTPRNCCAPDTASPRPKPSAPSPMSPAIAGGAAISFAITITLLVATIGSGMGAQLGAARLLYGMGRSNAIPKTFFGAIDPRTRIPRNNVIAVGAVALVGAYIIRDYDRAAELLNYGALIAFMGVNIASLTHYFIRGANRSLSNLLVPLCGFVICARTVVQPVEDGAHRRLHLDARRRSLRRRQNPRLPGRLGELRRAGRVGHLWLSLGRIARPVHPFRYFQSWRIFQKRSTIATSRWRQPRVTKRGRRRIS